MKEPSAVGYQPSDDDQPGNQQDGNNDACEGSAFGHGLVLFTLVYVIRYPTEDSGIG